MFSSRGTVRYEERGQGYRDVEKVGKHWSRLMSRMGLREVQTEICWTQKITARVRKGVGRCSSYYMGKRSRWLLERHVWSVIFLQYIMQ